MRSNEFTGATLEEAVRKATAVYRRPPCCEKKNQNRCNELILEISRTQSRLGRLADEIETLENEAKQLRNSAILELTLAMLAAISALSGALRAFRIISRRLKTTTPHRLTKREILDLLALLGPIGSAAMAIHAATQLLEARELAERASEIEQTGGRIGNELLFLLGEFERIGCGAKKPFTS